MTVLEAMKNSPPLSLVWDKGEGSSVKGLHLKTTKSGEKSFYLYYRTKNGTQRRPKIGPFPTLSLSSARKIAKEMWVEIASGRDPSQEKKDLRAELTIQELFDRTYDAHWSAERYQTSGWGGEVKLLFENHLQPTFGSLKLSDVTVSLIREWHSKYAEMHKYAGNRALSVLSRLFSFAEEKELRPQGSNPCLLIAKHKEAKRKRFATEGEIEQVLAILEREKENHPRATAFLYLLIFTGSRPKAIEDGRRDQIVRFMNEGREYGRLTFQGKTTAETGEEETIIFPPQALAVLDHLPPPKDGSLVGIKMPRGLWKKIREEVGCKDLWARDWRRTFSSIGLSNGVGMDALSEVLNHKSTQTTKIYARLLQDSKVKAVSAIADRIEAVKGG